jgi:hypothetical protein
MIIVGLLLAVTPHATRRFASAKARGRIISFRLATFRPSFGSATFRSTARIAWFWSPTFGLTCAGATAAAWLPFARSLTTFASCLAKSS